MNKQIYQLVTFIISCIAFFPATLSADQHCLSYTDGTRVSHLHPIKCPCHCARYPFSSKWNTCRACKHAHAITPGFAYPGVPARQATPGAASFLKETLLSEDCPA